MEIKRNSKVLDLQKIRYKINDITKNIMIHKVVNRYQILETQRIEC